MKKLLYVLPIIGLLLFASCDRDESDEVLDENLVEVDQGQIEITETADTKNFNFAIPPGFYGPTNVDVLDNNTYTYHPTQAQLNAIPLASRQYRVHFEVDNPLIGGTNWQHEGSFEAASNTVYIVFPIRFPGYTTRWRVRYEIYNKNSSTSFSKRKKVTVQPFPPAG